MKQIIKTILIVSTLIISVGCEQKNVRLDKNYTSISIVDTEGLRIKVTKHDNVWLEESYYFNDEMFLILMEEIMKHDYKLSRANLEENNIIYEISLTTDEGKVDNLKFYNDDWTTNLLHVELNGNIYEISSLFLKVFKPEMLYHYYIYNIEDELSRLEITDGYLDNTWSYENLNEIDNQDIFFDSWKLKGYFKNDYAMELDREAWFLYELSRPIGREIDVENFKSDYEVSLITKEKSYNYTVMLSDDFMIINYDGRFYKSHSSSLYRALTSPIDLIYRFAFITDIENIDTIEYIENSKTIEIDVTRNLINDKKVDRKELVELYQHLLLIYGESTVDKSEIHEVSGENPSIEVIYTLTDGTITTLDLYSYEDDYIISSNGHTDFKMNKNSLKDLKKIIKTYKRK